VQVGGGLEREDVGAFGGAGGGVGGLFGAADVSFAGVCAAS
jgi:hypothetical protein